MTELSGKLIYAAFHWPFGTGNYEHPTLIAASLPIFLTNQSKVSTSHKKMNGMIVVTCKLRAVHTQPQQNAALFVATVEHRVYNISLVHLCYFTCCMFVYLVKCIFVCFQDQARYEADLTES